MSKYNFKVEVDWDGVPTKCRCEYTGAEVPCLPVLVTYNLIGIEIPSRDRFVVSTSVCNELESGYLSAEEFCYDMEAKNDY